MTTNYKHKQWIRFFGAIGGAISLVFHALGIIFDMIPAAYIQGIIFGILGAVVDIILLGSLELLNHNWKVKMTWLNLLILGILDAVFFALSSPFGYGFLGSLCIIIAAFIGIIDKL
ncbi:MAG: hypothetical protein ACTSWY_07470 [Promethearchaeota archaeon]